MEMMGQGLVLMVFGIGFVYLSLWLMIVVIKHAKVVIGFGTSAAEGGLWAGF